MKIAILTQFPVDSASPHGGVEAVSVNLVSALAEYGDHSIDVITFVPALTSPEISKHPGFMLHRLPVPAVGQFRLYRTFAAEIATHYLQRLQPDIVHAHDTYGLAIRHWPGPSVFTVHGFIHGDIAVSTARFRWIKSAMWRWLETGGWSDQKNIIAISPYVREYVRQYSNAVIYDIDNPISDIYFQESGARDNEHPTVFCAGAISRRKNQRSLVLAAHKLVQRGVNVRMTLAGPFVEEAYTRELRDLISALGLGDRVSLPGSISSDRVRSELQKSRVFALPSREENSPVSIEEAMAMGIPVVTSNRCGMPYMVDHGYSGFLVDPESVDNIAEYIEKIIVDESLYCRLREESRRIAFRRFTKKAVAARTLGVYREIIERASRQ